MSLNEELLQATAKDGSIDCEKWPETLEPLLKRLDHIVYNEFPIPKVPPELAPSFASQPPFPSAYLFQDLSSFPSSNKENAPPSDLQTPPQLSAPLDPSSMLNDRIPDSQSSQTGPAEDSLPPQLLSLLVSIKSTLKYYFASKPPHTIQRLAELILHPTRQYRTLPAYLRAIDRVVSVSSTADIFPLPQTGIYGDSNIPNRTVNGSFMTVDNSLGSDESLGGALLTPIPWLNSAASERSSSDLLDEVSLPRRESGSVVQTNLRVQEQVVNTHTTPQQQRMIVIPVEGEPGPTNSSSSESSVEIPHARGPPVLGVADMGLQNGRGIELSLADSNVVEESQAAVSSDHLAEASNWKNGTSEGTDQDGDIALNDAAEREVGKEARTDAANEMEQKDLSSSGTTAGL
jgi:hypothetical protein